METVFKKLVKFSIPYLLTCFLQSFYGLADLFIVGQFNGASTITAVSVGSQLMHMITVVIVGLAMGSTVQISRSFGSKDDRAVAKFIGNTAVLFVVFSILFSGVLFLFSDKILQLLSVPAAALAEARTYSLICFAGVIFITAYNVLCSIYRGLGDTKHPMYFVIIAGVINVVLDYILIGPAHLGAQGAALATISSQAISVFLAGFCIPKFMKLRLSPSDFKADFKYIWKIFTGGFPIALQDGLIQVSFLIITMFANRRGVEIAAAVGIVEKIISFLFLVPSAMLSSVSTLCAQYIGAGKPKDGNKTLRYALICSVCSGIFFAILCNIFPLQLVSLFTDNEPLVDMYGAQYLRAYVIDCIFAAVHFCFSGYFCAVEKPILSFVHNILSISLIRIPFVYLATIYWPDNIYPMGLAAPMGSLLSAIICVIMYYFIKKKKRWQP